VGISIDVAELDPADPKTRYLKRKIPQKLAALGVSDWKFLVFFGPREERGSSFHF
jgi:hypothetical protein